ANSFGAPPQRGCRVGDPGASRWPRALSPRISGLELFVFLVLAGGRRRTARPQLLLEALGERAGCMVATRAKELIARGDFHENRNIAARSDRHANERHAKPEIGRASCRERGEERGA